MTSSSSISSAVDSALLVTLNIRMWSARKYDRSVSKEVDRNHGAKDGGRYNKLLIDKSALEPIEQIANAARQHQYTHSLNWGDNGERILAPQLLEGFMMDMQNFRMEFQSRARTFVNQYPQLKVEARKRLGSMYDANDYPADIADRFHFGTSYTPVPTENDFRVALSADTVEYLKRELTERHNERVKQAVKEVYTRARDIVGKIHEQTSDEDRRIYDSSIDKAREFVELLPALNLTKDPLLTSIAEDISRLLVPADRLRQDKTLRANTARAADEILSRLPWA